MNKIPNLRAVYMHHRILTPSTHTAPNYDRDRAHTKKPANGVILHHQLMLHTSFGLQSNSFIMGSIQFRVWLCAGDLQPEMARASARAICVVVGRRRRSSAAARHEKHSLVLDLCLLLHIYICPRRHSLANATAACPYDRMEALNLKRAKHRHITVFYNIYPFTPYRPVAIAAVPSLNFFRSPHVRSIETININHQTGGPGYNILCVCVCVHALLLLIAHCTTEKRM